MPHNRDTIERQRSGHPLVSTDGFDSLEAYCTYLVHLKAYEEAAKLANGKIVLDCGCNVGYGTSVIASAAARTLGVDLSDRVLAAARARYPEIHFQVVDGLSLPFKARSFELVVSFQVIEHVGEPTPYLSEIRRVLSPAGEALFTTPNARVRIRPGHSPWNQFHVREFTAEELRELLLGFFSEVTVCGLFGTGLVYEMELRRSLRARDAQRLWRSVRSAMRPYLPELVMRRLKRFRAGPRPDAEAFARLTTSELFYRGGDLDRAVDLMAICRP